MNYRFPEVLFLEFIPFRGNWLCIAPYVIIVILSSGGNVLTRFYLHVHDISQLWLLPALEFILPGYH
jgi:hypothetical protein